MDGVDGVSQAPIPPGGIFHYQFTLHQSGTYWYHGHTGFEEQQALYGAIVIHPKQAPAYHYNKDHVILLSDWTNSKPEQVYANLKKARGYYSSDFPLQPSLARFLHAYSVAKVTDRQQLISDYKLCTGQFFEAPADYS